MEDVFIRSLTFVLIIFIGYMLKTFHILKKSDADTLSTIIMNITLPCALLTSASGIELNTTIFILIGIGLLSNLSMIMFGYITSIKQDNCVRGAYMLNASGYNIGNFALAFIQSFFPGMGVAYLCSFDIGNAFMGLGITYALADHVASGENHFHLKDLFKKLFSSLPLDVYILVFVLALFKIQIPTQILSITSTIGAGNSFLAMLMIGLLLEIKISPNESKKVFQILLIRSIGASLLALITYFCLPIPLLAKKILIISYYSPLSSISAVFTKRIGYKGDMSATANSLSIIISIFIMTGLLLLFT